MTTLRTHSESAPRLRTLIDRLGSLTRDRNVVEGVPSSDQSVDAAEAGGYADPSASVELTIQTPYHLI